MVCVLPFCWLCLDTTNTAAQGVLGNAWDGESAVHISLGGIRAPLYTRPEGKSWVWDLQDSDPLRSKC